MNRGYEHGRRFKILPLRGKVGFSESMVNARNKGTAR